jgi:hypothetical protein
VKDNYLSDVKFTPKLNQVKLIDKNKFQNNINKHEINIKDNSFNKNNY